MNQNPRRGRCDAVAAATAQFYNTTGTVPSSLQLSTDLSYLFTSQPSCTIAVIDIPATVSERDLLGLFSRFGPVSNVQKIRYGQVALIEFSEISSPTRLVHMAKINPFYVGPNRVRLEFSTQNITVSQTERKPVAQPQPAPDTTGPAKILHLDIANAEYPITIDVIKAIASPHGKIQRIFIGKKNIDKSVEVLLEYETVEQSKVAKDNLDGADIYSGCCSLSVTYSRLQRVHVTENNSESWDFTGPTGDKEGPIAAPPKQKTLLSASSPEATTVNPQIALPATMSPSPIVSGTIASAVYPQTPQTTYPGYPMPVPGYPPYTPYAGMPTLSAVPPYYSSPVVPVSGYALSRMPPPSTYAGPPGVPFPQTAFPPPVQHSASATSKANTIISAYAHAKLSKTPSPYTILSTPAPVHHVTTGGIGIGHAASNLTSTTINSRQTDLSIFETREGVTIMASNLASTFNCDLLFNLLCVYGNVARIKFLRDRPGCAMIQMGSKEAADLIIKYFDGIQLFGSVLQFYHSKQSELIEADNLGTLPDGSPMMKNYMIDPNNRFRNAMVASKCRILEPTRTLHFFNVPLNLTPEDMCRILVDAGTPTPPRIVVFCSKPNQKTSLGLVEWDTIQEALTALILANHRPIHIAGGTHPFHLKLAFSPKPISDDRAGVSLMSYPAPPLVPLTRTISTSVISAPAIHNSALLDRNKQANETQVTGASNVNSNGSDFPASVTDSAEKKKCLESEEDPQNCPAESVSEGSGVRSGSEFYSGPRPPATPDRDIEEEANNDYDERPGMACRSLEGDQVEPCSDELYYHQVHARLERSRRNMQKSNEEPQPNSKADWSDDHSESDGVYASRKRSQFESDNHSSQSESWEDDAKYASKCVRYSESSGATTKPYL